MNRPTTSVFTEAVDIDSTAVDLANATVVYTVPANFMARVVYLHISNGGANNKKVSVNFFHAKDSQDKLLLDEFSMSANSVHDIIANGTLLYLKAGDKIEAFMESGGDFHICISLELYPETGYY